MRQGNYTTDTFLKKKAKKYGISVAVISKDEFPDQFGNHNNFIINLADRDKPGTHWVALHCTKSNKYYFDSFGMPAPYDVERVVGPYEYQNAQIQSLESGWCGYYCLMFLKAMESGQSYASFVNQFLEDPRKNLTILKSII